jgi:ribosomal protein S18 acetylase RimI-like enzyme
MVVTKNLGGISGKTLTETFNLAFGDYQLPLQMSEEQLSRNLVRYGYEPKVSIGLFDGDSLLGFVLNGMRNNQAYDCGTAIIPSYRQKGYSHALIDTAIQTMKQYNLESWLLEVLCDNTRAKNLYLAKGFLPKRKFNCYSLNTEPAAKGLLVTLQKETPSLLETETDCKASWQNSNESIVAGKVDIYAILSDGQQTGYLCFSQETGSIAQLYIYPQHRNKGIAKGALKAAVTLAKTHTLRCTNIDACNEPLNNLFIKSGFSLFTTQDEMLLPLD